MSTFLFFLLVLLQIGDVLTTLKILDKGGRELWGPQRWLMSQIGTIPSLLVTKGLLIGFIYFVVLPLGEPTNILLMLPVCLLYIWVVVHNLRNLK